MFIKSRSKRHWRRYREIVGNFVWHGFGFALNQPEPDWNSFRHVLRLPARKKPSIPSEDLALHFRLALEELGPAFIKLGKILSTRPDLLHPTHIAELSKLQDNVPPTPWELIREVSIQESGREPEQVLLIIDSQPLAVASLAQVHPATLPNGAEAVLNRASGGEELKIFTKLRKRIHTSAVLSSLKYIALSGRLIKYSADIADILDIKPILAVQEGKLEVMSRPQPV